MALIDFSKGNKAQFPMHGGPARRLGFASAVLAALSLASMCAASAGMPPDRMVGARLKVGTGVPVSQSTLFVEFGADGCTFSRNSSKCTGRICHRGSPGIMGIPPYPQGNANGDFIFYPGCSGSRAPHSSPVSAKTSFKNLYGVPVPSGTTPVMFVEIFEANRRGQIEFGDVGEGQSALAGNPFRPFGQYSVYAYVHGLIVGVPQPLVEAKPGSGTYSFDAGICGLDGLTLVYGSPIVFEFVQE